MPEFELVWEGQLREVYHVEAETEDEARDIWMDTKPVSSEALDGEIVDVTEVSDDE